MEVKLKQNTAKSKNKFAWRLIVDGVEELATEVFILVPCQTTEDHLTCEPEIIGRETYDGKVIVTLMKGLEIIV